MACIVSSGRFDPLLGDGWAEKMAEVVTDQGVVSDYAILLYDKIEGEFVPVESTLDISRLSQFDRELLNAFYKGSIEAIPPDEPRYIPRPITSENGPIGLIVYETVDRIEGLPYTNAGGESIDLSAQLISELVKNNMMDKLTTGVEENIEMVNRIVPTSSREAVFMFIDVRSFEEFRHKAEIADLDKRWNEPPAVKVINHFIRIVREELRKHHGAIHQFLGDGILAVFNTKLYEDITQACVRALRAAIEIKLRFDDIADSLLAQLLKHYDQSLTSFKHQFTIGVGTNVGGTPFQVIGEGSYRFLTVLHKKLNHAKAIEDSAGRSDHDYCSIMFSQSYNNRIGGSDGILTEKIDEVEYKNKNIPLYTFTEFHVDPQQMNPVLSDEWYRYVHHPPNHEPPDHSSNPSSDSYWWIERKEHPQ